MLTVAPTVESKGEFVQVSLEMANTHAAVVGATQPGFEVAHDLVNPGQETTGPLRSFLDPWSMLQAQRLPIPVFVEGDGVRANLATRGDIGRRELANEIPGEHRQMLHPDSTRMVTPIFHSDHDNLFGSRLPTKVTFLGASDVGVIQFDDPVERLPFRVHSGPTQTPAHVQGAPIGPDAPLVLELECRDAWGQGTHKVSRPKPVSDRKVAIVGGPFPQ